MRGSEHINKPQSKNKQKSFKMVCLMRIERALTIWL